MIDDGPVYLSGVNEKKNYNLIIMSTIAMLPINSFLIIIETFVPPPLSSYVHQKPSLICVLDLWWLSPCSIKFCWLLCLYIWNNPIAFQICSLAFLCTSFNKQSCLVHFVNWINQHLTSFLCGSNNVIIGLTYIMVLMKDKRGENFNSINLTRQDPPINNDSTNHEN